MLQVDKPDDYVLSMNEYHSVREFVEKTFKLTKTLIFTSVFIWNRIK